MWLFYSYKGIQKKKWLASILNISFFIITKSFDNNWHQGTFKKLRKKFYIIIVLIVFLEIHVYSRKNLCNEKIYFKILKKSHLPSWFWTLQIRICYTIILILYVCSTTIENFPLFVTHSNYAICYTLF